jgi:ribonuclease HI
LTGGRAGLARASAPARSIESITNRHFTQRAELTGILKALTTLQAPQGF